MNKSREELKKMILERIEEEFRHLLIPDDKLPEQLTINMKYENSRVILDVDFRRKEGK